MKMLFASNMKILIAKFSLTAEFGILCFYSVTVALTLAVSKAHQIFWGKYKIWEFLWCSSVEKNPVSRIQLSKCIGS